jgi:hypothetical protein
VTAPVLRDRGQPVAVEAPVGSPVEELLLPGPVEQGTPLLELVEPSEGSANPSEQITDTSGHRLHPLQPSEPVSFTVPGDGVRDHWQNRL